MTCAVVVFLAFNLVSQKNTALSKVDQLTAKITELENTVAEKDRQIEVYKRNEDAYQLKLTRKTEEYDNLCTSLGCRLPLDSGQGEVAAELG